MHTPGSRHYPTVNPMLSTLTSYFHPKPSTGQALEPSQSFRTENMFSGLLQKSPQLLVPCLGLKDSNSTPPEVSGSQAYQVWVNCPRWFLYRRRSSPGPPQHLAPAQPFSESQGFLHQLTPRKEGGVIQTVRSPRYPGLASQGIKERRALRPRLGLGGEIEPGRLTPKPAEEWGAKGSLTLSRAVRKSQRRWV